MFINTVPATSLAPVGKHSSSVSRLSKCLVTIGVRTATEYWYVQYCDSSPLHHQRQYYKAGDYCTRDHQICARATSCPSLHHHHMIMTQMTVGIDPLISHDMSIMSLFHSSTGRIACGNIGHALVVRHHLMMAMGTPAYYYCPSVVRLVQQGAGILLRDA